MPVFNDYSQNGELMQTRNEQLNATNLERYIKEHGIEQAQGYIDAINDFVKTLDTILDTPISENLCIPNSPAAVRREATKLYSEQFDFHKHAQGVLNDLRTSNSSEPLTPKS